MSHSHSAFPTYLITPTQLHQALKTNPPSRLSTSPRVIPICASWFLPNDPQKRTGPQVFAQAHIPGAQFFDLDKISDTSSPYPHMLPSPETFQSAMSDLGVNRDDTLVVYDTQELGIFSAPRVAWTMRIFNHPSVHVLNNFRLWVKEGLPVEDGEGRKLEKTRYPAVEIDQSKVVGFEEMRERARDVGKEGAEVVQTLDARPRGRWTGADPEPRPGLSSGHMPGSLSVPFVDLLDPETKALLPAEALKRVLKEKGVDPTVPLVSSCGTGVTAVVVDLALEEAYGTEGRVYDGSWTEWAQRVQPSENLILKSE